MNLKKAKYSLELKKISSSYALSGMSFTKRNRQYFNPYSTSSASKSSKKRTEKQELTSLMKLRNNIKTTMQFATDFKVDQLLSQQFKSINKRITKITENQMKEIAYQPIEDNTMIINDHTPYNKIENTIEKKHISSFNEKNNINTEENEELYQQNNQLQLLFKRFNDIEKINKEIKSMNINKEGKELPKYYFIREKVLLNHKPLFATSYPQKSSKINSTFFNRKICTKGLTLQNSQKSSINLINNTSFKARPINQQSHKLFLNMKLINHTTKHNYNKRPLTCNNSTGKFFNEVSSETTTILCNMKEIEESIQDKYYKTNNKNLLLSYTKRDQLKDHDESIENINMKRIDSKVYKTLQSVPNIVKKTYRDVCAKMEFENRILNKEAQLKYEQNEQMNKKYSILTQKKMNSIANFNTVDNKKEGNDLKQFPNFFNKLESHCRRNKEKLIKNTIEYL